MPQTIKDYVLSKIKNTSRKITSPAKTVKDRKLIFIAPERESHYPYDDLCNYFEYLYERGLLSISFQNL